MTKRLKRKRRQTSFWVGDKQPGIEAHFQGEMMTCALCTMQQRSDPNTESGWTMVEAVGRQAHFCPGCWHSIGQHYGYDNMGMIAIGIVMGSSEIKALAQSLIGK